MAQYIDKDALIVEIEKRIKETESMKPKFDQFWAGQISAFKGILKILDTLEVKEVDLREEIDVYFQKNKNGYNGLLICKKEDFSVIAKHFFELGLKTKTYQKNK